MEILLFKMFSGFILIYVISLILVLGIRYFVDFELSIDGKAHSKRQLEIWTYTPILNFTLSLCLVITIIRNYFNV